MKFTLYLLKTVLSALMEGWVSYLAESTGVFGQTQFSSTAPLLFTIPSLSHSYGKDDEDRLLCPVRSLQFYLFKVKTLRGSSKDFSYLLRERDITVTSISRWTASVIRKAYSALSETFLLLLSDLMNLEFCQHHGFLLTTLLLMTFSRQPT